LVIHRKAAAAISKFGKQPIDIMPSNRLKLATPQLKASDFALWMELMQEQDALQSGAELNKPVLT
jgi:NitT/TauT family transport system substrate-binding protein